jgi:hypothetical protein
MNAFSPMGGKPISIPQTNAEAALRLAAAGLHVFPCGPDKKPLGGIRWRDESSCDLEIVSAWWERWPDAVVGIDVGKARLVVIDADRHPGSPDGVAALPKLIGGPTMTLRSVSTILRQPVLEFKLGFLRVEMAG